jgi:hypothetical protein
MTLNEFLNERWFDLKDEIVVEKSAKVLELVAEALRDGNIHPNDVHEILREFIDLEEEDYFGTEGMKL